MQGKKNAALKHKLCDFLQFSVISSHSFLTRTIFSVKFPPCSQVFPVLEIRAVSNSIAKMRLPASMEFVLALGLEGFVRVHQIVSMD